MPYNGATESLKKYTMSKTRNEIITSMCYTYRHDYGSIKDVNSAIVFGNLVSGMCPEEREALWQQMAQIFDNDIAPYMEFKQ
jgi:hypothetical protein